VNNKYEIPDNFNGFNFGIPAKIVGYGGNKAVKSVAAQSTSTAAFIFGVLKDCIAEKGSLTTEAPAPFHSRFDDVARLIYLRTEVRFQDLNKGKPYILKFYKVL
jgi:hypothetical protein